MTTSFNDESKIILDVEFNLNGVGDTWVVNSMEISDDVDVLADVVISKKSDKVLDDILTGVGKFTKELGFIMVKVVEKILYYLFLLLLLLLLIEYSSMDDISIAYTFLIQVNDWVTDACIYFNQHNL